MLNDGVDAKANPALLQLLRDATHQSHEDVDAGFSSIDLSSRLGYQRFLSAHLMGISPIYSQFRDFVERELHLTAPDLPAMLRLDLTELDVDPSTLPALSAPAAPGGAAICYVVAGSRLGIASIRTGDYWAKDRGFASRYMEDSEGLAVWRALVGWMRDRRVTGDEAARQCSSAIAAFDLFCQALSRTQTQAV